MIKELNTMSSEKEECIIFRTFFCHTGWQQVLAFACYLNLFDDITIIQFI